MPIEELKRALRNSCQELFSLEVEPEITRPEEQFGDYATNVALQLAKQLGKNPREVAEQLAANLKGDYQTSIAGPGFINFRLSDQVLAEAARWATRLPEKYEGREILVEFGDPNPFKEMHIGHLYSYIVGDSISKLLEATGATVRRLSYHGDVGLHVAKAIWGMQNLPEGQYLGSYYTAGSKAYEEDEAARNQIHEINEHIYKKDNPKINELYEQGKQASFEHFDKTLAELRITNDHRYLESQSAETGVKFVRDSIGKVFTESQGAIVYEGEKVGLHTRVFITSKGLPTYETKDLGLAELKNKDYPSAYRSIILTANEQNEYFKVMLAALNEIDPALAAKTTHISHGFLSLSTGKMSSRTGEVYAAADLIENILETVSDQFPGLEAKGDVYRAALKYTFLKNRIGGDILFDIKESVSMEGNSGPYLQYAHARAVSILAKAEPGQVTDQKLDPAERSLARKISEYPEAVEKATSELMPHHVCTYLYELSQNFNRFYEQSRVIGDERQNIRLQLVKNYADVLKNGLSLLNITAPEKM
jgi:arginyl-tRNA synthetase